MPKKSVLEEWTTPSKLALMAGWRRNGCTIETIAGNIGVTRQTLFNWQKISKEVAAALKYGKEEADYVVENALFVKAAGGDLGAICFWLKNRKSSVWQDRYRSDIDLKTKVTGEAADEIRDFMNRMMDDGQ